MAKICAICNDAGEHARFTIREMMIGLREEFDYFQCARCGCLQIESIPENMAPYYDEGYYSFASSPDGRNALKQAAFNMRTKYYMQGRGLVGAALARLYPNMVLPLVAPLLKSKDERILDIGCGTGADIHALKSAGYGNTRGADPFIENRIEYSNGLVIEKKTIFEMEPAWDVIIMNHSLEHMPEQHAVMGRLAALLIPEGTAVISIPIASCEAWEIYGRDWVQADAPRHFYLHTMQSFTSLVEAHGLALDRVDYNSGEFQFYGSELYRRDVPLRRYREMSKREQRAMFSDETMQEYRRRADELNRSQRGDQITAYVKRGV